MPLITPPIKNIKEVTGPLKVEILNGNVHTINEMKAWLKPLGYSDAINEAAINSILREFVMSKVSCDEMSNMDMIVELLRPPLGSAAFPVKNWRSQRKILNLFVKPDDQSQTCLGYGMARKGRMIFNQSLSWDCTTIVILLVHQVHL
jgi:hypothetical protein